MVLAERAIAFEVKIGLDEDRMSSKVFGMTIVLESAEFSCLIFILNIRQEPCQETKKANNALI